MRVRFWGVRGSIPVPGRQTNRYGGNTSCVEIEAPGHEPIIIDAGTGIRRLGKDLLLRDVGAPLSAHVLISHTHWDHIQGLPYFSPLYAAGNHLHIYARQREDAHLRRIFASQHEGPYFPVPLDDLRAKVEFHELIEGQHFSVGRASVRCTRLNHPWIAIAYRVELDGASLVYASDTAPFTDILFEHEFIGTPPAPGKLDPADAAKLRSMKAALIELCRGADLLIYDTQFTPEEYRQKPHWGHSTPDDAIAIAREAEVGTLALYHHAPARSDDEQDAIVAQYRAALVGGPLELVAAYEGLTIDVGRPTAAPMPGGGRR
jgi:phosphoribosyl 1,2-cyclic phosphodiesterase